MAYGNTLREEEIKNRLRKDFFNEYDASPILGDVDFAVAIPSSGLQLFETEYLLWAEAKKGTHHNLEESLVQLILTIGKARTHEHHMPPRYLGAFDAEKIAFIPYDCVVDVFGQNDFNWNVKPSDHQTKEFIQLQHLVSGTIERCLLRFFYDRDDKELKKFIKNFFRYDTSSTKIRISKSNFIHIFQKWLAEVKPTIGIDWEAAKRGGIYEGDFYLADILSKDDCTLREKLNVLLRTDRYILDRRIDDTGLENQKIAYFMDEGRAHLQFWNRYRRPPKREYWEYIVSRQDLLVSQDVRERKGSFFTPQQWVELSQQYLADELGENWQDEYYVWDCAAGTGNLLVGLTNKFNIWASTIDKRDVDAMHDRIQNGANLLDSHVFQFDFLNDPSTNLPQGLQDIINDPDKRRKLVIYINPPYAEASNARTSSGTGSNRPGLSGTNIAQKYKRDLGRAANEIYAQFFARIVREFPSCVLAAFSTLKTLQGPNFTEFRRLFPAKLGRIFLVPANTFDNVKGSFPIGFQIWDTEKKDEFTSITADVYNSDGERIGTKNIYAYHENRYIIEWLRQFYDKENERIAYLRMLGTDFQNNNGIFLTLSPSANDIKQVKGTWVTRYNVLPISIYFAVRLCIPADWLNDRDQFLYPNDGWKDDKEFQSDCLIYALFHGQNRISVGGHACERDKSGYKPVGSCNAESFASYVNHWIPFTEKEVEAKDCFESHFMSDFIHGRYKKVRTKEEQQEYEKDGKNYHTADAFGEQTTSTSIDGTLPLVLTPEAQTVMDAGRELWRYYHQQMGANPNASFYDIRLHFQGTKTMKNGKQQMNSDSQDAHYTQLIKALRQAQRVLAKRIEPKIYKYGFLKK